MITVPNHVTLTAEELAHLEHTICGLINGKLDFAKLTIAAEIIDKPKWLGHFFHELAQKGIELDLESPCARAIGEEAWEHFRRISPTLAAQRMYLIAKAEAKEAC